MSIRIGILGYGNLGRGVECAVRQNPDMAALIFLIVLVSAVLIFVTEIFTKRWFPYLLKAPYHYLFGAILVICFMGAFSSTTSMFSVYLVLGFGLLGILMNMFDMPTTPLMLSFILWMMVLSMLTSLLSAMLGTVIASTISMLLQLMLSVYMQTSICAFYEAYRTR